MKQFWLTVIGSIAGVLTGVALCLVLAAFAVAGLIGSAVDGMNEPALPGTDQDLVLTVDLREARPDQPSASPLTRNAPLSLIELSQALTQARSDSRVAAVFVRAAETDLPAARAEEINALLGAVSAAGKPVIAHTQGFTDGSILPYWAVSAADALWMQDIARFTAGLDLAAHSPASPTAQTGSEPAPGESRPVAAATPDWRIAQQDSALAALARDRDLPADTLRDRLQSAPYSAQQALDLGLADQLGHVADARRSVLDRIGEQARFIDIADYHREMTPAAAPMTPVIALIGVQGEIASGDSSTLPGLETAGADTLAQALELAARDRTVAAIIVRIDSPGGSPTAADQVRDAVQRARQAGKPVIASLGDRAPADAYSIAAAADRIIANATTMTGAIGAARSEPVLFASLTPEQRAAYRALEDDAHDALTRQIARGRDLPQARIQALARGQVWTGQQALELGLIDALGGFDAALASARERAGLSPSQAVRLQLFPAPPSGLEALEALLGISLEGLQNAAALEALLDSPHAEALLRSHAAQTAEDEPAVPASPEQNPL